jgi:hypothetical protein
VKAGRDGAFAGAPSEHQSESWPGKREREREIGCAMEREERDKERERTRHLYGTMKVTFIIRVTPTLMCLYFNLTQHLVESKIVKGPEHFTALIIL